MAVSAARTIVLPALPLQTLVWPTALSDAELDYSLDMTAPLADAGDTVAAAAVSAAPSGPGELVVVSVAVAANVLTTVLGGGIPGRFYAIKVEVTTTGGRTFAWSVQLRIFSPRNGPVDAATQPGFGEPVGWQMSDDATFMIVGG